MPASIQKRSSALLVPLSSPRATKGARAAAIFAQRLDGVLRALDMRRVAARSDQDEIVVHHLTPVNAETTRDKVQLCRLIVDENDIAVAALADLQGLAGADRNNADLNAARFGECGQEIAKEPRLLGRGGRRNRNELLLSGGARSVRQCNQVSCDSKTRNKTVTLLPSAPRPRESALRR